MYPVGDLTVARNTAQNGINPEMPEDQKHVAS